MCNIMLVMNYFYGYVILIVGLFMVLVLIAGYYTRSGYVPGPICKYVWEKVWKSIKDLNPPNKGDKTRPPVSINF